MLLNTTRIMLIFCLIAIVCAPKPSSTREKKTSTAERKTTAEMKKTSAKDIKEKPTAKPKRIGFLTACALASNISPDLALNYGPKAYKAMKKRYESGKAHLKVKGKDGKLRNATKGEAIRINLSKPETYAVLEKSKRDPKKQEAIVAHPMLLNYNPPDPKDIRDTPVTAAHMPHNGYQWDQYGNTASTDDYYQQAHQQYTDNSYYQQYTGDTNGQQNPYSVQSSYNVYTPEVNYSPHDSYTGPSTQDVKYTTYEQPNTYETYEVQDTYTDLPEHTPHYPEQGPPKHEIPPSRAITDVTLWPGFMEQLPDGSWMEAYHIPYAFAEESTFSTKDKERIRRSMDKFAEKTCVRFTPTWYDGQHHIVIDNKEGGGCCSWAGVETFYGNQSLNFETPGCMDESVRIHELMHATGIHHTQQRADRDQHVKVFWDNIVEEHKTDYQLFTNYLPPYPYDKRSVMHYQSIHGNLYAEYAAVADLNNKPIIHEEKVRQSDWHAINVNYQCDYYLGLEKNKDPKDIHVTSKVIVEHNGYQYPNGYNAPYGYNAPTYGHQQTQQYDDNPFSQQYTGNSQYTANSYSEPYTDDYNSQPYMGDPNSQQYNKVPYTTYEQPSTYTGVPDHTPHNPEQGPPQNEIPRSTAIKEITLWPGFMERLRDGTWIEAYHIPYTFSQDYPFTPEDQKLIRKVMDKFEQMTCVRFTPTWYEGQHRVIIENKPGEGCCSFAGIEKYYGNQTFNLETPGCMYEDIIAHEMGHVAGLHHTQQRADRDKYVKVYWDYISDKYKGDFTLYTNYLPQVPYDTQSIMHYMSNHGNAWPQYSSVTDSNNKPLDHERKVQLGDYHWINTSYQCEFYMKYTKSYFANWNSAS